MKKESNTSIYNGKKIKNSPISGYKRNLGVGREVF
jgi:hypothetical protein